MSILPPVFPTAPPEYNQEEERAFRGRVMEAIGQRLGQDSLPQFGGIPNTQVTGTNAAFSVPIGATPTILPFNSILWDTTGDAILFDTGTFAYSVNIEMAALMFFRLRHAAASGGNVDMLITLLVNGVAAESYGYTANLSDVFDVSDTFFPVVGLASLGLPVQLAVSHNNSQPVLFDMTKSKWAALQLSPNKLFTERTLV